MADNVSYHIDRAKISEQKMQFNVINRRPNYSTKEILTVKAEIEEQLFAVFCKFEQPN